MLLRVPVRRIAAVRPLPLARAAPQTSALLMRRANALRYMSTDGGSSSSDAKPAEDGKSAEGAAEAEAGADAAAEEGGDTAAPSETEVLQAKVEELEAAVKDKHDQVLRALAEAENARRRAGIDVENAHKFAVGKFAKSLLDIADNLGRAAESVPEEQRTSDDAPVLKSLYEGVTMTEKMLVKTFEEHGLKRIWPLDEKFDPNIHNALFEMPDPDKEPGTVAHVASAGYVLHDRVIRAAGVGIVSKPA